MNKKKFPYCITDKWAKSKVLAHCGGLSIHVPETVLLSRKSLQSMLAKYAMVYVKPREGSGGSGVMKAEKKPKGHFGYQIGKVKRSFPNFDRFFESIQKEIKQEPYLLQQGIHLLQYKGRPFDFRLMIQKKPSGAWSVAGEVGRVAHPAKIVTNGSQGGTIYPVGHLLLPHTSALQRKRLTRKIHWLGIAGTRQLQSRYPGIREIGMDIAIDRNLKPWILEANTVPDICPFTKLRDQSMLREIVRNGKRYGRIYNLVCNKAQQGV